MKHFYVILDDPKAVIDLEILSKYLFWGGERQYLLFYSGVISTGSTKPVNFWTVKLTSKGEVQCPDTMSAVIFLRFHWSYIGVMASAGAALRLGQSDFGLI